MGRHGSIVRMLIVVPVLAAGLAVGMARPAAAASYNCVGGVNGQTIKGNVVVPAGFDCELVDAVITGNVTVKGDASLYVDSGSEVRGSISASKAYVLYIYEATVRGSVSSSGAAFVDIHEADIRGNVAISGTTQFIDLDDSVFRASVVLNNNLNQDSEFINFFEANIVSINVICSDNVNLSFTDNEIGGNISAECYDYDS